MSDAGKRIQPFYFVFDTSGPTDSSLLEFGDEFLRRFFRTVAGDPNVDDWLRVRFVHLGNSMVSPGLIQLSNCLGIPKLTVEPLISLTQELSQLKKFIEDDLTELRNDNCSVFRPVTLLFLSGDLSGEDWANECRQLSNRLTFRFAPNIFVFTSETKNVSDLSGLLAKTQDSIGIRSAYVLEHSHDVEPVARTIVDHFVMNVMRLHVNAWIVERPPFRIPDSLPGIRKIDADLLVELSSDKGSTEGVDADEEVVSVDNGQSVIPIYFVCDESYSALGDTADFINAELGELFRLIASDPIIDEKARVSIVFFSETASVSLPLSKISDVHQVQGCVVDGVSAYAPVFRLLKSQIENDVFQLEAEGFAVHRPFVFFITHGRPVDKYWREELAKLVDSKFGGRPHIVSFGLAGADPAVIKEVSTPLIVGSSRKESYACLADEGVTPSMALKELLKFTINS